MINTLILENEAIKDICTTVIDKIDNINIKYTKNFQKNKKEYDLYIMFLNLANEELEEKILFKNFSKNVIIFIENYNNKFLWNITNYYNPIDVMLTTIPTEVITERLINSIKKVESDIYEKM
ncbi:MAG: hypothetical protein E7311_03660 [Clostridiales bacterium]|nr:hypothetical protein [Clostridiales bacterium]